MGRLVFWLRGTLWQDVTRGGNAPGGVDALETEADEREVQDRGRIAKGGKLVGHLGVHLGLLEDERSVGLQRVKRTLQERIPGLGVVGHQ